jgi:hypothetical protein
VVKQMDEDHGGMTMLIKCSAWKKKKEKNKKLKTKV